MSQKLRRLTAAGSVLVATAVALPAMATAVAPTTVAPTTAGQRSGPLPYLDVRDATTATSAAPARTLPAADRAARDKLVRGLGRQAALEADPVTATPRTFGRLDRALTSARAGDPAAIALDYVRANASALGLSDADFATLRLADRTTIDGITTLRWRQEVRGVPAFDNELRVNVDGDGRVINVLGAPRHALSVASTTPRLSAADALATLARDVGSARRPAVTSGPTGPRDETTFASGDRARLVLFGDVTAVRLAWHLTLDAAPNAWYDAVVDASTGRVLRRVNLTKGIDGRVFDNYPGAPNGGQQRTVDLDPYLTNPTTATALAGPFARAWSDVNDAPPTDVPEALEEVAPGRYDFVDFTPLVGAAGACDAGHLCSWDHRPPADPNAPPSWTVNRRQNAVQAFWYVNNFHDHLLADPINFTPEWGNFEDADRVKVESDDGADGPGRLPDDDHVDNANMSTPPDGQSPRMQMYLFKRGDLSDGTPSPFRDVNGGDDASVVYHEYTHGLSSRLITTADGVEAVNSAQAGAMGEAWSDWYAKDFLVRQGFQVDTAAPGEVDMGEYVDAVPNQIRREPLDCPVGAGPPACPGTPTADAGGFTYGDFGRISARGPEVHNDGEIWAETLWDLRTELGSDVSERIITDGMRFSPAEPSFLDARNAILQADIAAFQGVHVDAIWSVFAERGMGFFAGTAGSNDTAPVENFDPAPPAGGPSGPIGGRVTDSVTGAPLAGIAVGVGGLDTPPSSFVATTDPNGAYAIGPVPAGTYPVVLFHPSVGYEPFTARRVNVVADTGATLNAALRRDWATTTAGAAVAATNDDVFADFGCGTNGAFDLDFGNGWSAYNQTAAGVSGFPPNPHRGAPPTATVRLPQATNVTGFGVDPSNTCNDDTSSATKDLRIEVSSDGTTFTPVATPSYTTANLGRINDVPVGTIANVRFVRITMLTNQLSAGAPAGAAGRAFTDLTEFEVFGAPSLATAPPPATGGGTPPAGGANPAPQPQPQPQPGSGTAPTQTLSRPTGAIATSRTRGRATFTVGCSLACRATATMTVSRATAKRLRLRSTRLARVTRSLAAAGRRTFALTVSSATQRRIRARGVRTVSTTVTVAIRDSRGQTRTVRRAVRIRVR